MSNSNLVVLLLDEIDKRFLKIIQDLSEDDLVYRSDIQHPSIGWTIGHLVGGQHIYYNLILRGENPDQIQFYSPYSEGSGDYTGQPSFNDMKKLYSTEFELLKRWVCELEAKYFKKQPEKKDLLPPFFASQTINQILSGYIAHFLTHTGQMIEIKRLLKKEIKNINS